MKIRLYKKGDMEQVAQLFQDTVTILDTNEYTETEIRMRAPNSVQFRDWEGTCLQEFTLVAVVNNEIVGFSQLNKDGHINAFYCRPDHQGKGIGKQLYAIIEDYALSKGITKIYTEVNASVQSFFNHLGFESLQEQTTIIHGEMKTYYVVQKDLSSLK